MPSRWSLSLTNQLHLNRAAGITSALCRFNQNSHINVTASLGTFQQEDHTLIRDMYFTTKKNKEVPHINRESVILESDQKRKNFPAALSDVARQKNKENLDPDDTSCEESLLDRKSNNKSITRRVCQAAGAFP